VADGRTSWGGYLGLLEDDDRAAFLALGRQRRFRAGQPLLLAGDRSDHVLCITSGGAKISIDTVEGRELLLGLRGPGDLLGELAAVDPGGSTRSASVIALGPLTSVVMTGQELRRFLDDHRLAARALMVLLARRLRQADRKRIEFGSLDTPGRVAHVLIEMAETHGRPGPDGLVIDLPLSQEEIAGLIAASRESVARGLAGLRDRGLISTARRSIVVRDLDGLRAATTGL
jgi:CRP-like cAMP-binding protein